MIGDKIRRLRLEHELTQEELADRSELTKGYISQVERDLASPSIATLQDILEALGTTLGDFFTDSMNEEKIVFNVAHASIKREKKFNRTIRWIVPNAQKNQMEPILLELKPGGQSTEEEPHRGEEFGYVLKGEVDLMLGKKRHRVKKGESFYYKADKDHYIINNSKTTATVLWVSTPPTF